MSKEKEKQAPPAVAEKGTAAPPAERKTVEAWAEALETPDWLFAAAMAGAFKAEGRELSKVQYLAALKHIANTPIGYTSSGVRVARDAHDAVDATDPAAVEAYEAKFIRRKRGEK